MKKYFSFFRLRFTMGLQYRAAAAAGIVTQFLWGAMEILIYRAFYQADPSAFPMTLQATCCYIWLQQAFLALFMGWMMESEIFESIQNGSIAYELCRPVDLYNMWFSRSLAHRLARAVLRCMPILLVTALIPAPYGMTLPTSPMAALGFIVGIALGLWITVAICMLVYILTFFTLSPAGIRIVAVSAIEFLSGAVLPLPFFPDTLRKIMELLPFASMQNVPYRIYSLDLTGTLALRALGLQCFWAIALVILGRLLMRTACRHVVVQGG